MTGQPAYRIPFNRPTHVGAEIGSVGEALASGRLAANGPFTKRCEEELEAITTAGKALLTGSCTQALEIAALLLEGEPGDEVIVPSFAYVSTANAFAMRGLRPVFADCRPDTLTLDVAVLPRLVTSRTRAIVALHYGGVACDLDEIADFARTRRLTLVEDNAHGLFGRYKGRPLGSVGRFATQSFHETKNITCGEGGALLINDPESVDRAMVVAEKGTNHRRFLLGEVDAYTWVDLGSSCKPSEIQAAWLWAQLGARLEIQRRRHAIWARYHEELQDWATANGVGLPTVPAHCEHPAHLYYLLLPSEAVRRRLIDRLKGLGILAVFHYQPLHVSPMGRTFGGAPGDCPVTERITSQLLRLPLYTGLSHDDQSEVIERIRQFRA